MYARSIAEGGKYLNQLGPRQMKKLREQWEELYGEGSWASVYRSFVSFADWNTCYTAQVADVPDLNRKDNIKFTLLEAFRDLGRSLCFDIRGPIGIRKSLPKAIKEINNYL